MSTIAGLDPQALARIRQFGGTGLVAELVEIFRRETPERLSLARAGLARGELKTVAETMHALRSSAGNLGARQMVELALAIEQQAAQRRPEGLAEALAGLTEAFAALDDDLAAAARTP